MVLTVPSVFQIREAFSAQLRERLRQRFRGKLPSASMVAREFNLRAGVAPLISQESARRWIRGNSIPDAPRLAVLAAWLSLDFNAALRPARPSCPVCSPCERPGLRLPPCGDAPAIDDGQHP